MLVMKGPPARVVESGRRRPHVFGVRLQGAAHTALSLGALEGLLADANGIKGLLTLAPGVDLLPIKVPGRCGGLEAQRERQPLVDLLRGRGLRVDALHWP